MAADVANGNLPAGVQILQEGTSGHDEGRAMADLIHKIAPGAQIAFYSATTSEAGFASGIAALQAAGCNVIVDDVAYLDEPFFQDGGMVQTAVENAVDAGVSYFTAASNEGENYVEQDFTPMRLVPQGLPGGVVVQNFGSAADPQPWVDVTVPKGGELMLDMQWDQPFATIGSGHSSANSIGMALYNSAGQLVAITSTDVVGGNPVQLLTYTNSSSDTNLRLVVFANGGSSLPGTFKIINYGNGTINNDAGTGSGTVIGHEMVAGANTVGAVAYSATTAFGGTNTVENFSSVGTGTILYGANGQRLLTPESSSKVNFVAPDGSVTSVFAPFYGTSAAAPNAAAVAALMLQADPSLTPGQVTQLLEESAAPATGSDMAAGSGLIQADAAVQLALNYAHSHV
jgi:subtilisin family serine protease